MSGQRSVFAAAIAAASVAVATAQSGGTATLDQRGGLDPALLRQPLGASWPTYSGDYSGRRFSALAQINKRTVRSLGLAWTARLTGGPGVTSSALRPPAGAPPALRQAPVSVGGPGPDNMMFRGPLSVRGSVLAVDGVLYVTAPDHVWAIDARDGHELWRYFWKTRGGTHIGNRGAAIWRNVILFETPDNYLVAVDATTGQERWSVEIAKFEEQYFSTPAPIVIDDHVLVGTGNDLDMPGFLQSYDAKTGALEWKLYTVPMKPGDPGLETWPSLEAARHGGAQVWLPGAYDPETRLYIVGTGNPTPAYTGAPRPGDNLFTCSLIAVNVDTGRMAWYFQTSAHDTHDWDSAQTPILIDGVIDGRPRKLVSTASRNGYFYTLDRLTGEHLVTSRFGSATNWAKGLRPNGVVEPDLNKSAIIPGTLVSPIEGGVTNWPPAAFSPRAGLFYVHERNAFNLLYLTDPDPRGSMGLGGKTVAPVGSAPGYLTAIDYRTGKVGWRRLLPGAVTPGAPGGVLATAGDLLFTGDASGNFVAFDAANGSPLWHTRIGNISAAPITYELDGRQYVLAAVADMLYAFAIY
jgi:alcohol dehydrogenase (cytochrome c)